MSCFEKIQQHQGHEIVCVTYGNQNAAIECETCHEVLVDYDNQHEASTQSPIDIAIESLQFYARGNHLQCFNEWETVSGEPSNWVFPAWDGSDTQDRPEGVEIGEIAAHAITRIKETLT